MRRITNRAAVLLALAAAAPFVGAQTFSPELLDGPTSGGAT